MAGSLFNSKVFLAFIVGLAWTGCINQSKPVNAQKKDSARATMTNAKLDSAKKAESKDSIKSAQEEKAYEESFVLKNYIVKNAPAKDLQKVDSDAVIIVYPDSMQVEQMKKEDGDDFYTVADDAQYYQSQTMQMCDSVKIKYLIPQKRYIRFESKTKTIYFDTRAKAPQGWITLLFRTDSLPRIVSVFDVISDSNLKAYFKRK